MGGPDNQQLEQSWLPSQFLLAQLRQISQADVSFMTEIQGGTDDA
jgi:hypothetical protein